MASGRQYEGLEAEGREFTQATVLTVLHQAVKASVQAITGHSKPSQTSPWNRTDTIFDL